MNIAILQARLARGATAFSYLSMVLIFAWFGGMKFSAYEAAAISDLVSNSPLLSWTYALLSPALVSGAIGVIELSVAALLAARLLSPTLAALGAAGAAATFVLTSTFLLSTPGVVETSIGFPGISVVPGQFLLKDLGLLAISLMLLAESLGAVQNRSVRRAHI